MPRIGTRPVIASLASVIRRSWRRVGGSRPGRKHAKTVIISGMGGGSSCRVGLGNPDSTCCRRSTHLHFYTVLSRPASLPFLAKVLIEKREKVFSLLEARGYVGNPQGCPSGGG